MGYSKCICETRNLQGDGVVDSRPTVISGLDGSQIKAIRRHRKCGQCFLSYSTYEISDGIHKLRPSPEYNQRLNRLIRLLTAHLQRIEAPTEDVSA